MYRSLPNPALSLEYTFGICGCSSEAFIWLDLLSKIKCDTKSKILLQKLVSDKINLLLEKHETGLRIFVTKLFKKKSAIYEQVCGGSTLARFTFQNKM
jgi:hypothetical protein